MKKWVRKEAGHRWQLSLDQIGSANARTFQYAGGFGGAIIVVGIVVVVFGNLKLPAYPLFANFHAGFVFLMDLLTAILLYGQYIYRRLVLYLVLASAYLFNSLMAILFLLTFPGALKAQGVVLGGSQSSIWVWHIWHILFPLIIAAAFLPRLRDEGSQIARKYISWRIGQSAAATILLVTVASLLVSVFENHLPILITRGPSPLTRAFYLVGGTVALVTAAALAISLRFVVQRRTLHLWIAVALTGYLADIAASLAASSRYSVGWYFGRAESMFASSVLLMVLINEINRLYRHLSATMGQLISANERLSEAVEEKDRLVVELRSAEEEVRQLAYYDAVTGLPNRWLLMERLQLALVHGERYRHATAVLFLDLDKFKRVNDTMGHDAGDELLHSVAQCLLNCIRSGDTASRLGGDEFVIVLPEIKQQHDAVVVAEKVVAALNEPLTVAGKPIRVTTSIGIAVHTSHDDLDSHELLRRADAAMYEAKKSGRNRYRVSTES